MADLMAGSSRRVPTWDWSGLTAVALRETERYLDPERARDAAQEAALRAWRRAHTCSGSPEPWVRVIARNEALRILTKRQEDPLPDNYEPPSATTDAVTPEDRLTLAAALTSLSEDELRSIFLRYWSDKTEAQIAAMVNVPEGTIKIRLHRARLKLAQSLRSRPN
jgi:RNA polymerase sigma-70 factor (ECF subfamily)